MHSLFLPVCQYILFRSSRPDFIETFLSLNFLMRMTTYCSGLPGRTSLRRRHPVIHIFVFDALFRSSMPDFIETRGTPPLPPILLHCSGLPGRTSLRHVLGRLGHDGFPSRLFRSSRPDFIETQ